VIEEHISLAMARLHSTEFPEGRGLARQFLGIRRGIGEVSFPGTQQ
jgi:hypothetical protein